MKTGNQTLVYGWHAVYALLQGKSQTISEIWLSRNRENPRLQLVADLASERHIPIRQMPTESLNTLAATDKHQGIVALIKTTQSKQYSESDITDLCVQHAEPPFLLLLDNIQDPHNLGAVLRSANASGTHAVISSTDRSVGMTPIVKKVASGAAEYTPFIPVTNLARTIEHLKKMDIWIFGAAEEGEINLFEADLSGPIAIVLGNEEKGLRQLTRKSCDHLVRIPMFGSVSSLNISVAAGILLFEVRKQREGSK